MAAYELMHGEAYDRIGRSAVRLLMACIGWEPPGKLSASHAI